MPLSCFLALLCAKRMPEFSVNSKVVDLVMTLRNAVHDEDWGSLFADGFTMHRVEPYWCATAERCDKLKSLCKASGATTVLEVGTFCGCAALAMAEVLPHDGAVLAMDLDPYIVNFGEEIKNKTMDWHKVRHMIGPAKESLQKLVEAGPAELGPPFDFVVIDADKAGMLDYFKLLWDSPGMLVDKATVCVDTTPFKGQLYVQYVKGKLDDFVVKSGQDNIDAFLAHVRALPDVELKESSGLAIVQRSSKAAS